MTFFCSITRPFSSGKNAKLALQILKDMDLANTKVGTNNLNIPTACNRLSIAYSKSFLSNVDGASTFVDRSEKQTVFKYRLG